MLLMWKAVLCKINILAQNRFANALYIKVRKNAWSAQQNFNFIFASSKFLMAEFAPEAISFNYCMPSYFKFNFLNILVETYIWDKLSKSKLCQLWQLWHTFYKHCFERWPAFKPEKHFFFFKIYFLVTVSVIVSQNWDLWLVLEKNRLWEAFLFLSEETRNADPDIGKSLLPFKFLNYEVFFHWQ